MMDKNGKINGLKPVFNDVLAFVFWKLKCSDIQPLVDVVSTFYLIEDLMEAWEIIHSFAGHNGSGIRLPPELRFRYRSDLAVAIVKYLKDNFTKIKCKFIALDLNRIPFVDVMDNESVAIFLEEHKVRSQLHEVLLEQAAVKSQLADIAEQLRRIGDEKRHENIQVSAHRAKFALPQGKTQPPSPQPSQCHRPVKSTVGRTAPEPNQANPTEEPVDTIVEVAQNPVPRGYIADGDGFMARIKRPAQKQRLQRHMVTGVKTQMKLKPTVNDTRIFGTKFNAEETADNIKAYLLEQIGAECSVERIVSRTRRHSSFLITANKKYEQVLLNPNTWEEGVQVRHFYGRLRSSEGH